MLKKFSLALLLISSFFSLSAARPSAKAIPADGEILLDGRLTEECWKKAPVCSGFTILKSGAPSNEKSDNLRFRVLRGERGLYFGVEVKDQKIKSVKRPFNGPVWHDDSVEIFLSPVKEFPQDRNIRELYQFIINADGSQFSQKYTGGAGTPWNCPWRTGAQRTKEGWSVEVYIPFQPFAGSASDVWRLNLAHNDYLSNTPQSVWSPTATFSDTDNTGYLEGITFDRSFYSASFQQIRMENGILSGTVQGVGKRNLAVKALFRKGGKFAAFGATEVSRKGDFSIPLDPGEGEFTGELYLTDGSYTVSSVTRKFFCTKAPATVHLIRPWYRNTLFPDEPRKITAEVRFGGKKTSLLFTLTDAKGSKIAEQTVKKGEKLRFSVKGLAPGRYQIRSEQITIPIQIFRKGKYVRFEQGNRCFVNGKAFYPRCFDGCGQKSLPVLAKYGYNLAQSYVLQYGDIDKILKRLDAAHQQGIMVLFYPYHKSGVGFFGFTNEKGMPERMEKLVRAVKEHPALFGWYLYDEPRGAEYTAKLKDFYLRLREIDPGHPVIGCDNSAGSCIDKTGHCDIHQLDIYPNPDRNGKMRIPIAAIVNSTRQTVEAVREGVWIVPEGFYHGSFSKEKNPNSRSLNVKEILISVYGPIAAGASGVSVYKIGDPTVSPRHSNSGIYATEEMRKGYLDILGPELKSLEKVLTSPSFQPKGKGVMRGWHAPDGDWILAVNPDTVKQEIVLNHPAPLKEWKGKRTFPKGENRIVLAPYEVLFLKQ